MKKDRTPIDRSKGQFARLMELDRRIRAGKYPNCLSFSVDWEVSQKTVQRDIDYLRDQLGAPLEYDRVKQGFYYTEPNWFLPALSLSEGDMLALLIGSQALDAYRGSPAASHLSGIFQRLAAMLPQGITIEPEMLFNRFSVTAPPSRIVDPGIWRSVVRGLCHHLKLEITYNRIDQDKGSRMGIYPYHLANLQGEWYLFAKCDGDGVVRQLALSRIKKAEVTDIPYQMPADFDVRKVTGGSFARATVGKTYTVKLLFSGGSANWVTERQWHPEQKLNRRKDGKTELQFPARGLYEVMRWVLAWGRDVEVLSPAELKRTVAEEVEAMFKQCRKRGKR
jgi:predicted DNA-binding transcriptional regulator YafY